jgi:hypothetical protein
MVSRECASSQGGEQTERGTAHQHTLRRAPQQPTAMTPLYRVLQLAVLWSICIQAFLLPAPHLLCKASWPQSRAGCTHLHVNSIQQGGLPHGVRTAGCDSGDERRVGGSSRQGMWVGRPGTRAVWLTPGSLTGP